MLVLTVLHSSLLFMYREGMSHVTTYT